MNLRESLLAIMAQPDYRAADRRQLLKLLDLNPKKKRQIEHELRLLMASGDVVQHSDHRFALRSAAKASSAPKALVDQGLLKGRIQFRAGGSAIFFPEPMEGQPKPEVVQISPDDTGLALGGDIVQVHVNTGRKRHPRTGDNELTGRVTNVVERKLTSVVGTLRMIRRQLIVAADDPRYPHDIWVDDPAKAPVGQIPKPGDKVVAELYPWERRRDQIRGKIVEVLGRTFDPGAEYLGILRKFDLVPEFPAAVIAEAKAFARKVPASAAAGRRDFRGVETFTIDPDDAKDFDDALSLQALDDGKFQVGVHIADVSHYVKPGTALDKEAKRRGNSTYLVGTVIPMLPESLSNGLCSLVEAEDRLTKAVLFTFSAQGEITHAEFANTIIRSNKRLTYRQAYAFLFKDNLDEIRALPLPPKHQTGSTGRALSTLSDEELNGIQKAVRQLWKFASRLRADRMRHGSLDLDMMETKIFVDEQGYADRLEKVENDESHQLIEEFMLAANEAVARLTKRQRMPSIYRVHEDPDPEKLTEFSLYVKTFNLTAGDLTNRHELTKLLAQFNDHPQGHILRTQLLRSLKKADYRAVPEGHFGLAKNDYTHFTSPIRRFADLVVHRVFQHYLVKQGDAKAGDEPTFKLGKAEMTSLAEHISITEQNSTEAERESVKIKTLEFFERQTAKDKSATFAAVITDIRSHGLFVELTESGTFGFLPGSALGKDYFDKTPAGDAFVGRKTKKRFGLGDRISVRVISVDRVKRQIDFGLAEPAGPKRERGRASPEDLATAQRIFVRSADRKPKPAAKGKPATKPKNPGSAKPKGKGTAKPAARRPGPASPKAQPPRKSSGPKRTVGPKTRTSVGPKRPIKRPKR